MQTQLCKARPLWCFSNNKLSFIPCQPDVCSDKARKRNGEGRLSEPVLTCLNLALAPELSFDRSRVEKGKTQIHQICRN